MSAASWIRVANGFRLVASAATNIIAKEGSNGAASLTRHGVDLANNARTAAKAANTMFPVKVEIDKSTFDIPKNATPKQDNVDIEVTPIVQSMPKRMSSQTDSAVTDSMSKIEERSTSLGTETTRETKAIPEMSTETKEIPIMGTETAKKSKKIPGMRTETTVETKEKPNIQTNLPVLREGQAVPSTRVGRAFGFASLGVGLAAGTMFEAASRLVSLGSKSDSIVANDANADRLAKTLCRMRGAALKLGQMLSIQDETLLPPTLSRALEQVRQGADAMPSRQLRQQLEKELGKEWRSKFETFEDLPFAAASIGQVHRATIIENGETKNVVVKIQYPGVADSIDSDLKNLTMLVKMSGFAPKGLFIEKVIQVGRDELVVECDYKREAQNQERLRNLVHGCPDLARERFRVPSVMPNHSTQGILTTEYCPGGTIDKVAFLDQEERNRIGRNIMRLTVKELFQWRFMQTDPNWGNFLYDVGTGTTHLIDFGSAREYSKSFVDGYLRIVWACANDDSDTLMAQSHKMGFLTGEENDIMLEAHKQSGFTLGEPFATSDAYDFKASGITGRISDHGSAFMQHRLTPPPEEVYTLHRKLAGAFNLCIKLGANIKCRDLLEEIVVNHVFEDGQPPPRKY